MSKKHVTPMRQQRQGGARPRDNERTHRDSDNGRFVLGSEAMAKLNAIEGIRQSPESRKMFAGFERSSASDEERRRAIVARHAKQG